jgi:hypothetical protein
MIAPRAIAGRPGDWHGRKAKVLTPKQLLGRRGPFRDLNNTPVEDSLNIFDYDISKGTRVPMGPERVEFRLHPSD